MKEKIEQFIKDNSLDLSSSGSGLNSVCTILCGYALYLKIGIVDLVNIMEEIDPEFNFAELERVYLYAEPNHYEKFWMTAKAKKMYKF